MSDVNDQIASPESTGGAGSTFEQQVNAFWLSLLLVRGVPPIHCRSTVSDVAFQTKHLGWETDDFLVTSVDGQNRNLRLLGQVKRSLTISATDTECKATFEGFWADFSCTSFSRQTDRLVLVVLRGTNLILDHLSGLLDCARVARNNADFQHRLETKGLLHQTSIRYFKEISKIIAGVGADPVDEVDVWEFLRNIHILSFDLGTATRQTESVVKSLLAYTTVNPDAIGQAEATWTALVRIASEAMPAAGQIRRDDLPEELRQHHAPTTTASSRCLDALRAHTTPIVNGIRCRIGETNLSRDVLTQELLDALNVNQVVMVSGPAGKGKSVVAKAVFDLMAQDHFAFAFRAEEFAKPHFDETLSNAKVPVNSVELCAILAGQDRKLLLVESVERLLEHSTRDAFGDLLDLVRRDPTWRVVLTCRDYSRDLVRSAFLSSPPLQHAVLTVPNLNDEELRVVSTSNPSLALPLADASMRDLLRNPYVLDKATQISWAAEAELPKNCRDFRGLFWRDVIRKDDRPAGGMPGRRHDVFVEVARRRAKSLALYVAAADLPHDVRTLLRNDAILVVNPGSDRLCAPAHDVLEDWAILRWIDETYVASDRSMSSLAEAVGEYPAIRRTYRTWIAEQVEASPTVADDLLQGCLLAEDLPAHFRDDTLVSLLRSKTSDVWLLKHEETLFSQDRKLLRRLIHLLRVACVESDLATAEVSSGPLQFLPEGVAWTSVLTIVARNVARFDGNDRDLLLGLITDWSALISRDNPYPVGSPEAVQIAHHLAPLFGGYLEDDRRKRTLTIIAKLPKIMPERFAELLMIQSSQSRRDDCREEFRKIVLFSFDGIAACRDVPEVVAAAARDELLLLDTDLELSGRYHYTPMLEPYFGLKHEHDGEFSLDTAWRGPFMFLLRFDYQRTGLPLILDVVNHTTEWYARPRMLVERLEPPDEMVLRFADGSEQAQWCNDRLWKMYRGTHVGPAILKCALMAMERFLFEVATQVDGPLDGPLLRILKGTNSAALTAVVASVATAFPHRCGETLLVLLRSRVCIQLDRSRMVADMNPPSSWGLGGLRGSNLAMIGEKERKEADERPHRRNDLENAILTLQLGNLRDRVQRELDDLGTKLAPLDQQTADDQAWRLSLHRMDLRQYDLRGMTAEPSDSESSEGLESTRHMAVLDPRPPATDLQPLVADAAERGVVHDRHLRLLNWGLSMFTRDGKADPERWEELLEDAQVLAQQTSAPMPPEFIRGGPAIVAAVCVRDHWEEISSVAQSWCIDIVCAAVEREADNWNHTARVQHNSMSPDRCSALVIWRFLSTSMVSKARTRILYVASLTVTHAIDEVRQYGALGIARYVASTDRALADRCVSAIATQASSVARDSKKEREKHYAGKKYRSLDEVEYLIALEIREIIQGKRELPGESLASLDMSDWFGARAALLILPIVREAASDASTADVFSKVAVTVAAAWTRREDHSRHEHRDFEAEHALERQLAHYCALAPIETVKTVVGPLLAALHSSPSDAARFIEDLVYKEDDIQNTPQFWSTWQMFADAVVSAKWTAWLDERRSSADEVIRAIFLNIRWKDGVGTWRSLVGHEQYTRGLFERLPPSALVLGCYVRMLFRVGAACLPNAFVALAARLGAGDPAKMLGDSNTVFMLESLLQRHVYGRPLELKANPNMKASVLRLLDMLVDAGSSAAFRMRDDFVTPLRLD